MARVFTVCDRALEVLPVKFVSPPYTAVIECEATESKEVLKVATPEPFSGPVPNVFVPSLKVTVPVGVPVLPVELSVTVAVNVTELLNTEGFCDELTVVLVLAWLTVCVTALELLAPKVSETPA